MVIGHCKSSLTFQDEVAPGVLEVPDHLHAVYISMSCRSMQSTIDMQHTVTTEGQLDTGCICMPCNNACEHISEAGQPTKSCVLEASADQPRAPWYACSGLISEK
jgi:hypothetical protein